MRVLAILALCWANVVISEKLPPCNPALGATSCFSTCSANSSSIYQPNFLFQTLPTVPFGTGKNTTLNDHFGSVVLVVNVATFWGHAYQYVDMNMLLRNYSSQGLHVVALPCDQFYLQEPGRNDEILNGIRHVRPGNNFIPHTNMSIYSKINVNGISAHPLYNQLKNSCPQTLPQTSVIASKSYIFWDYITPNDITWNYEKFLVDRTGKPRYRFHPSAWNKGEFVVPWLKILLAEPHPVKTTSTGKPQISTSMSTSSSSFLNLQIGLQRLIGLDWLLLLL